MQSLCTREKVLLFCFTIFTSIWFAFTHHAKSYYIFSPISFIEHKVGLPFGARFLVYEVGNLISSVLNETLSTRLMKYFYLTDAVFVFLSLVLMFYIVFNSFGSKNMAFLSVLSLCYVLFFHFVINPIHNYYYAYDIASIAFMTFFLYSLLNHNRFWLLLVIVFFATLNRESALLMPLVFFVMLYKLISSRILVFKIFLLVLAWGLAKMAVYFFVSSMNISGEVVSLYDENGLRLIRNIRIVCFLLPLANTFAFYSSFGFLWIWVLVNSRPMVHRFEYFIYIILFYILSMMVVGNIDEIRIYNECLVLFVLIFISKLSNTQRESAV